MCLAHGRAVQHLVRHPRHALSAVANALAKISLDSVIQRDVNEN